MALSGRWQAKRECHFIEAKPQIFNHVGGSRHGNVTFYVRKRTDDSRAALHHASVLYDFLNLNRIELIARCKAKVAKRIEPLGPSSVADHGVPLFLQQLIDILSAGESLAAADTPEPDPTPAPTPIGRAAALHGAEMLRLGYSIDQVVHEYGDLCQAVTELAYEQGEAISAEEFRMLNLCLDNAIADAVTAFSRTRQKSIDHHAETLEQHLQAYSAEQRRIVDIASQVFAAIKTGNVGLNGLTSALLGHALQELRALPARGLLEVRLASASTTVSFP